MQTPFKHIEYDKLSDDITFIGYNTVLRFNVTLSKPTKENKRYYFHHEYGYNSNKYVDTNNLVTLRRQFDYYLSIENIRPNDSGIKEFIQIRARDILYFRDQLNEVCRWFRDAKFSNLFAYNNDNRLIMLGRVDPIEILNLSLDKFLKFEPIILSFNNTDKVGVRMFLSSSDNYVDLDIDRLMEFTYYIQSINMYESAQLLLNYLQRPELGTNYHKFDRNSSVEFMEDEDFIEAKAPKRVLENKRNPKQKSYFDKIDELK